MLHRPYESAEQQDAVIAVRNVEAANLAWALIEAAKTRMNSVECNYAFVTVGAGDTFAAIRQLLKPIDAKRLTDTPAHVLYPGNRS
jgi:hypothetical protein